MFRNSHFLFLVENHASTGCVFAPWVQSLNFSSVSKESSIIIQPKGTPETTFFLFWGRRIGSWDWRWDWELGLRKEIRYPPGSMNLQCCHLKVWPCGRAVYGMTTSTPWGFKSMSLGPEDLVFSATLWRLRVDSITDAEIKSGSLSEKMTTLCFRWLGHVAWLNCISLWRNKYLKELEIISFYPFPCWGFSRILVSDGPYPRVQCPVISSSPYLSLGEIPNDWLIFLVT